MKFNYAVLSVFSLAASLAGVSAQDTTGIPTCAYGCFVQAISASGCALTDVNCQCTSGSAAIAKAAAPCITSSCSAQDALLVQPAAEAICSKHMAGTSGTATAAAVTAVAASASPSGTAAAAASPDASGTKNAAGRRAAGEYVVAVVVVAAAAGALVV